jgi:hypothetical protein
VILAAGLGVPLLLGVLGVGPDYLPVTQLYFFDPRRAAIVYPLWAIAWAGLLVCAWEARGRWRLGISAGAGAFVLMGVLSAGHYAVAGAGAPPSFHPERYMLCPDTQPVLETAVCIDTLLEEQVEALEALSEDPRLAAPFDRRAVLQGFASVTVDDGLCSLPGDSVRTDDPPADEASQAMHEALVWEGVGLAAGASCSPTEVPTICGLSDTPSAVQSCQDAAVRAKGLGK